MSAACKNFKFEKNKIQNTNPNPSRRRHRRLPVVATQRPLQIRRPCLPTTADATLPSGHTAHSHHRCRRARGPSPSSPWSPAEDTPPLHRICKGREGRGGEASRIPRARRAASCRIRVGMAVAARSMRGLAAARRIRTSTAGGGHSLCLMSRCHCCYAAALP